MRLRANLAQSAALIRAPQAWADGYTGKDQTIAIIDSGVDKAHPFLGGRIVSEACYTSGQCPGGGSASTASGSGVPCTGSIVCQHGTHVAGIAAGYQSTAFSGIAPDAKLISINVFSSFLGDAGTNAADVVAALNRVYELRGSYSIAAVNMSLGSAVRYATTCDGELPSITAAINQLKAAGIATIIASGNNGDSRRIAFPACISSAVSVGSVSDSNWGTCAGAGIASSPTAIDKVACYSNAYEELSLLAPGSPSCRRYRAAHMPRSTEPPWPRHMWRALSRCCGRRRPAHLSTTSRHAARHRPAGNRLSQRRHHHAAHRREGGGRQHRFKRRAPRDQSQHQRQGDGDVLARRQQIKLHRQLREHICSGTSVTLTAAPGASMSFAGWGGACAGLTTCTITMTAAKPVFAAFFPISSGPPTLLSVSKTGSGTGSISILADGQVTTCSGTCERAYGKNTKVILTANPAYGTAISSWTGACRGKKSTCTVRLSSPKSVSANFAALPVYSLAYAKTGAASGTVQISSPSQTMTCGASCSHSFPAGSRITLTAIPAAGKAFDGWSGICKGRKTLCSFTLRSSGSVSAVFN